MPDEVADEAADASTGDGDGDGDGVGGDEAGSVPIGSPGVASAEGAAVVVSVVVAAVAASGEPPPVAPAVGNVPVSARVTSQMPIAAATATTPLPSAIIERPDVVGVPTGAAATEGDAAQDESPGAGGSVDPDSASVAEGAAVRGGGVT